MEIVIRLHDQKKTTTLKVISRNEQHENNNAVNLIRILTRVNHCASPLFEIWREANLFIVLKEA